MELDGLDKKTQLFRHKLLDLVLLSKSLHTVPRRFVRTQKQV